MPDTIRAGIIGVGWGGTVHVPAFKLVPEFEVVVLCGSGTGHAADVAARNGIPESATDWEQVVRREDIDVIVVATPVALHYPMVMAAVAAGKHVLCEKSVALTAQEAQAMAEAAEAVGVASAVSFEFRRFPERMAVAQLVADGFLGQPHLTIVTQAASMWHPSAPPPAPWKLSLAAGGGYLNAVLCHELDYLCWLHGPPESLSAVARTEFPRRHLADGRELVADADETCAIEVRFRNGAVGVITGSAVSPAGSPYRFEASGSDGAIAYSVGPTGPAGHVASPGGKEQPLALSQRRPRSGLLPEPGRPLARQVEATALLLEDWLPALTGVRTSGVPSLRDGYLVQRMVDAVRTSSAESRWIAL